MWMANSTAQRMRRRSPLVRVSAEPPRQSRNKPTMPKPAPTQICSPVFLPRNMPIMGTKIMYSPVMNPPFPAESVSMIPTC